jgi:multicomponent Na+:H+ antiporter subunit B
MTATVVLVILLIGFMIAGSLIAIETRDLLSSVIAIGAVGFGLAIIYLLLAAPDLALTQVVVEVLTLVLLIRLVVTRRDTAHQTSRDTLGIGVVSIGMGVLLVVALVSFQTLAPFGRPLAGAPDQAPSTATMGGAYLKHGLETGAANYVMGVLLDFRAYDTLGEATVIFAAIIGAFVVMRAVGRLGEKQESEVSP